MNSNQQGVQCDVCDTWLHAKCIGISEDEYRDLQCSEDAWCCANCYKQAMPLANISNSDSIFVDTSCSVDSGDTSSANALTPRSSSSTATPTSSGPASSAPTTRNSVRCQLLNARSVVNKRHDLEALLISRKLDVLAVTETFLSDVILDSELVNDDFVVFRQDRDRHGGGVMLIFNNDIPATRRQDLETDCEVLWVELSLSSTIVLVGVFLQPPRLHKQ